jgi:hypothetical protein
MAQTFAQNRAVPRSFFWPLPEWIRSLDQFRLNRGPADISQHSRHSGVPEFVEVQQLMHDPATVLDFKLLLVTAQ